MIFRTLQPHELDLWAAHCAEVFGEPAAYFRGHFTQDSDADVNLIFVAMDGDVIASTVRVFARRIWLQGRAVSMGGIGEVSTKPAYRQQGLAAALLRLAIDAMVARGMQVSVLFGDQTIYTQAGWRFCSTQRALIQTDGLSVLPEKQEVRPFEMADLPFVMGAYDLYAGRMDGAIMRDEAYWRRWVLPQWKNPWVLVHVGLPAAYACYEASPDGTLHISELMAAPQGEKLILGFLRILASQALCTQIDIATPLLPKGINGVDVSRPKDAMLRLNIPMMGLHDSDALVASIHHAGMCGVDSF